MLFFCNYFKSSICNYQTNFKTSLHFTTKQKEHNGQYLLDFVYKNLNINEKDYFGLRYVDHHKQRNWLDPTRPIYKQVKGKLSHHNLQFSEFRQ